MNSSRLPEPTRSERNGGSRLPAAPPTATDGSSRSNAAPWSGLPGLTKPRQPELLQRLSVAGTDKDSLPDDNFFEQLMKMQVYYFAYIHPMSIVTVNNVRCLVFFSYPRYLYFFWKQLSWVEEWQIFRKLLCLLRQSNSFYMIMSKRTMMNISIMTLLYFISGDPYWGPEVKPAWEWVLGCSWCTWRTTHSCTHYTWRGLLLTYL